MPLSRLENFLKNTDGNIIYVNPSDLDATDSVENQGNSLTRPFKTIQRALLESARFSYNIGPNNDRFDKTTILVYPGTHYIDNRPGHVIANDNQSFLQLDPNISAVVDPVYVSASLSELSSTSNFDIFDSNNDLYKFNSTEGGVILPRGTSITGMDLRKTKIRPLFVPDPENTLIDSSAIFRITGGCYIYQFTIFDGDQNGLVYKNYRTDKYTPNYSHHKLTVFEYTDGANELGKVSIASTTSKLTDLQMYYIKVQKAYGDSSGRGIGDFPSTTDLEATTPEFRIVGAVNANDIGISSITAIGTLATIDTATAHGLVVDDSVRVSGVSSNLYNGSFSVAGVGSATRFSYTLPTTPASFAPALTGNPLIVIEPDTVSGASPYIYNTSLRSTFGMNGLHADGSKVSGFKSVVVAQYTGIGIQKDDNAFVLYDKDSGTYKTESQISDVSLKPLHLNSRAIHRPSYESTHIKVSNNSIIQAVSVFAIGYANHFLAESGGDQSITNSNSNFGAKALVSSGFRDEAFDRDDVGYITHTIPPKELNPDDVTISFTSLDVGLINAGSSNTSRLYLFGFTDPDIAPPNIISGYRIGAKNEDELKLEINEQIFSAPILMPIQGSGNGTSARKQFTVARTNNLNSISSNIITLTSAHTFINGESVRVISDSGHLPDGLINDSLYFVITNTFDGTLTASTIKLAKTFNDATVGTPVAATINNGNGGILTIESRVTDKSPGELGHPIQYDTTTSNWYVSSGITTATNKVKQAISDNSSLLSTQTGRSFILRKEDNRIADDKIYRLRYVIPKEFTRAKAPAPSFVIQESSTVGVSSSAEYTAVGDVTKQRNVKIIANAAYDNGNIITVTTEKPHKFNVNDVVILNKIKSSDNPVGTAGSAYNDTYSVATVVDSKKFTVTTTKSPGSFVDNTSTRDENLPTVSRNQYKNTYYIYSVDTIQEHIPSQRDGIYHLICLDGSVSPSTSDGTFDSKRFSQNIGNTYPTVDRDNYNSDPELARSYALPDTLGDVIVNDRRSSITKETTLNYYKDTRIGFAITNATSNASGITTVFTNVEHNLNSINSFSITNTGGGYGTGITTTLFNIPLVGTGITGGGATANVQVNAAGQITGMSIVDGGSAYGVGNTMRVGVGSTGIVTITAINNNIGSVIEVVGVGTTANRYASGYNGAFRITGINSTRSVTYTVTNNNNTAINAGIYTAISNYNGLFVVTDQATSVSNIGYGNSSVGIVTVTSNSHGLYPGNKFRLVGVGETVYNGNYTVTQRVGINTFVFNIGAGTSNPAVTSYSNVFVLRNAISAQAEDTNINSEKIAGRLSNFYAGFSTTTGGAVTGTASTIKFSSLAGISTGEYFQLENEIIRLSNNFNNTTGVANVLRGLLGTRAEAHETGIIARKIDIIPTELRRYSAIRASGHTFEYVGFGHGNYSVALPQRQDRNLTKTEQVLSQSIKSDGGSVIYDGLNDSGDSYIGNTKTSAVNGESETINAPIETYLGDEISSLSVNFDDVTIKNTLKVSGGTGGLQSSEFKGPVSFSKKVTSTSTDGVEVNRLKLKGSLSQARIFGISDNIAPIFAPDNTGDVFLNGNPVNGGFFGFVNVGNAAADWRRFGLISRSSTETYITPDRIGVNTSGTLRTLPNASGSPQALVDIRGGVVADNLRIIGNADFVNGASFASVEFGDLVITGITTFRGTTDSNSSTTGIVTCAGGIGIAKNLNVGGNFQVAGISTFVGNVTFKGGTINIGDGDTDDINVAGEFISGLVPNATATFDIGTGSKKWRHASFSGIVTATTFVGDLTGSISGNAATVTTNANLTGHVTSVGNAAVLGSFTSLQLLTALTDETGTGANVFATSPTLVTPILGTPTSGTLTNCTFPTLNQNTTGNANTATTATNVVGTSGQVLFNNGTNTTTTSANLTFDGTNLVCGGTVTASSDEKLKENIQTIENALDKVMNLRGVEYDRKDSGEHQIGVIAQEVERIIPEVVYGDQTKSVAYGNLVGLLIEAIKEQQKEIDELKKTMYK